MRVTAITTSARGYWVVNDAGTVAGVGVPALAGSSPARPVAAAAATPTGVGLWLAGADGSVAARGTAVVQGDALPQPLPPSVSKVLRASIPPVVVAIVAAPTGGYWILRDNGGITARGGAPELGVSGNLALFTN